MSAGRSPLADLSPASFAMVMATGIVSIAGELRGWHAFAWSLFWLNLALYAVLWVLTVLRAARHAGRFRDDLADHNRSVGFFTVVAGTCIVGNQLVVIAERPEIAVGLWFFGIALWAVTNYTIFLLLTVKPEKPSLAQGINGGWLVAVVAAQAVATLGGLLAPHFHEAQEIALFFSLVMWLGGAMLYIWIMGLIFYRYTFFPLSPSDLAPPYWINMGAMAISTLAGTVLIGNADHWSLLAELRPFLKGLTLLFWSTATWWIPLLVLLGIWRHGVRRFPLRYDVLYWGAVFPLGMYTVCTQRLADVLEWPPLQIVPRYFIYIAVVAWALTTMGLIGRLVGRLREPVA
ncbi:MAG: tellurite resistance/C4-dicarboxylate transporter family protein [Planctomycetales bacterium]